MEKGSCNLLFAGDLVPHESAPSIRSLNYGSEFGSTLPGVGPTTRLVAMEMQLDER